MNSNCDMCEIVNDKTERLVTTKHWIATVAPDQGYLGRTYITSRKHREHLHEINTVEWQDFAKIVDQLEKAVTAAFGAALFNWSCLMNNAYQKEEPTPHVHWHFRPRYSNPVIINGEEFTDRDFGFHYDREHRKVVSTDMINVITKAIQIEF